MTNLLRSKAAFLEHAEGCRLTAADRAELVRQGIDEIATLAYALSVPGVTPEEDAIRRLLNSASPASVSMSSLSGLRRFIFEAQTLCVAQVKMSVEGTEAERKFELVPAERNSRIDAQRKRLTGLALTGQLECAFSCYTYIGEILSADVITYPEPHRFIPRSQEVMREKPGKEIVLDES